MKSMEKFTVLSPSLLLTSTFSISIALPEMLKYYDHFSRTQVELLISLPSFAITGMILLNAWLAKYMKERVMISCGLLLLACSGLVPVFIQAYPVVFVSRILFGMGIGLINARAISIISERYEGNERAVLLGYRGSAEVLGNAVLTLAAGKLLLFGWKYVFVIYLSGFLILALYLACLPSEKRKADDHKGHTGSSTATAMTKADWRFTLVYAVFASVLICLNSSNSMRIPGLVLERGFGTEAEASVILSIIMAMGILAGMVFGRLAGILRKRLLVYGLLALGGGMLLMAYSGSLIVLGVGAVITGIFHSLALTYVFHAVSDKLPQALVNTATSVILVGCNLGAAFSPAVLKSIGSISDGVEMPFVVFAVLVISIGVLLVPVIRRKRTPDRY